LGGAELRFDEWKLDYVLTGSQKAIALPPGLAFAVASDEMVKLAESSKNRGVYFDIAEMERYAQGNQVPATPAFSLLYALEVQLEAIKSEGVENRWARHRDMAAATAQWIEHTGVDGLENIVAPESRSPTVSTIRLPANINGKTFVKDVKAASGIQVGGGYGKLADTTFRIGHMGDHTVATLNACFEACEAALKA
jgi:aspartate aminotransferase-like enzyme